jgi:hypothetical protein
MSNKCPERDNPFCYIQKEDRRKLLRILFPTIDHDLLFYPKMDNEELLDELGIPKQVQGVFPYIITSDEEVREYLYEAMREFRRKKTEEYRNKDNNE